MVDFDDRAPLTGDDEWRGSEFVSSDADDRRDAFRDRYGVMGAQTSGTFPALGDRTKKTIATTIKPARKPKR